MARFDDAALPRIGRASARDRIVPRLDAALKFLVPRHLNDQRYEETVLAIRDAIDAIKDLQRFLINR